MERDIKPGKILSQRELDCLTDAINKRKTAVLDTMTAANQALIEERITEEGAEIVAGFRDVNCFFSYEGLESNRVLHVRVGFIENDETQIRLSMRELNRVDMLLDRQTTSIGDEHRQVREIFPTTKVPNDLDYITRLLGKELTPPPSGIVLTETRFSITD